MKGVSAIIAIILILMIVVALAALAYTWFSGIFASLTETAQTGMTRTTEAMATNFVIEAAKCNTTGNKINGTMRSVGTTPINVTAMIPYVNDVKKTIDYKEKATINQYDTTDFGVSTTCAVGDQLKITDKTGLAKTVTVT